MAAYERLADSKRQLPKQLQWENNKIQAFGWQVRVQLKSCSMTCQFSRDIPGVGIEI